MITAKQVSTYLDLGKWKPENSEVIKEEVSKYMSILEEHCSKDKSLRDDIRSILVRFIKNGQKLRGTTNCNVLGTHVVGSNYGKEGSPAKSKIQRNLYNGELLYAEAIANAVTKTNAQFEFKLNKDDAYNSFDDACTAHMIESLSSKGPYDGGTLETPFEVAYKLIHDIMEASGFNDEDLVLYDEFLQDRYDEYMRCKSVGWKPEPKNYVSSIAEKGLSKTFRGFPFECAGNKEFDDRFILRWNLLWDKAPAMQIDEKYLNDRKEQVKTEFDTYLSFTKDKERIQDPYHRVTQGKYTIDAFLQDMLIRYFALNLDPVDWFTPLHAVCIPISRNQGRGFKYNSYERAKHTEIRLVGERDDKGMKYRPVVPAPAFINALMHLMWHDLVKGRPKSDFSAGLSYPEDNNKRMKKIIHDVKTEGFVLDSLDFSNYDFTISTKLMFVLVCLYAMLYSEHAIAKNVAKATALLVYHKVMIVPERISTNSVNEILSSKTGMTAGVLNKIKGDPRYAARKRTSKYMNLEQQSDSDYRAIYFTAPHCYLISGLYLTAAIGGDVSAGTSYYVVPKLIFGKRPRTKIPSAGDDIVFPVPIEVWMKSGFDYRKDVSEGFKRLQLHVHPLKQSNITFNGVPIVIFLQLLYPQDESIEAFTGPTKNLYRQVTGLLYDERMSDLRMFLQWIIPISRAEAGIDHNRVEFAGEFIKNLIMETANVSRKYKFKPKNSPELIHKSRSLGDHSHMIINENYLNGVDDCGGFKTLLGLIKTYGQDFIPALGRAMGSVDYLESISGELELRAAHKESLREILRAAIEGENVSYHWYAIDAFQHAIKEYEKISSVEIPSLHLVDVDALVEMGKDTISSGDDLSLVDDPSGEFDL